MKIRYLILFSFLLVRQILFAQSPVNLVVKQFYAPGTGNYIELYSEIDPGYFQINKIKDSGNFCHVQELVLLKQGDKILDYRKNNIRSPFYTDSVIVPFIQMKRIPTATGKYTLEYEISDLLNKDANPIKANIVVDVADRGFNTTVSQVEFVEKISTTIVNKEFEKSGHEIWPYVSDYFPEYIEKLAYYAEIYFEKTSIESQEKFVLTQYISSFETNEKIDGFSKLSKITASPVLPVLNSMDIKNLPTGNYNLVIEIRNKSNELIANEISFFQRLNTMNSYSKESLNETSINGTFVFDINNTDTLNDFLACIVPIALNTEADIARLQIKNGDPLSKKQFFYLFWKSRDATNPEAAWLNYKKEVNKADALFSTRIKRGYETDRGRVFLKYGPPNHITDRPNEPSAYPYQIWQYYKLGKFNNKIFMFYMPDLVSNDYEVLHSDVPGEYRNPRWEAMLYSRDTPNTNIDFPNQNNTNHFGGNVNELIKNPR